MIIANGNVLNMTPTNRDWVVTFDLGGDTEKVTCPVIGWATVVQTVLKDGTATTTIEPAFLWGDQVWTETDLREHSPALSDFKIRA